MLECERLMNNGIFFGSDVFVGYKYSPIKKYECFKFSCSLHKTYETQHVGNYNLESRSECKWNIRSLVMDSHSACVPLGFPLGVHEDNPSDNVLFFYETYPSYLMVQHTSICKHLLQIHRHAHQMNYSLISDYASCVCNYECVRMQSHVSIARDASQS